MDYTSLHTMPGLIRGQRAATRRLGRKKDFRGRVLSFCIPVFLVLLAVSCSRHPQPGTAPTPLDRLRTELDVIFEDTAFQNAHWGVAIQSLKNGQYIYLRNENKGFMPASNMKLFTTATALVKLSPDYRFETPLYSTGPINNTGVLEGDLVIRGSGDPSITGRYHNDNMMAVFESWVDSLRVAGVSVVEGNVVGDDNYFEDEIMGAGWAWDYQSDWYAAQISALSFNDNCVDIIFTPGDTLGAPANYRLEPETDFVAINCSVTTVVDGREKGIFFDRKRGTNLVDITGSISMQSEETRDWFSVENPTLFAAHVFRETLQRNGIDVRGEAKDIDDLDDYTYLDQRPQVHARYVSPPLHEIVKTINKRSQNLYAELLMRTLGAKLKGVGDAPHGAEVMEEFFSSIGIDPSIIGIADGSGLSRYDLVTPKQVITLLRAMRRHDVNEYFYDSLPIAGVDGTIKSRMRGTAAENNVRAKTGYIGRVRALSGYVTTLDGEEIIFSMITNNYTVPTSMANNIQDLVCERLANFSRKM